MLLNEVWSVKTVWTNGPDHSLLFWKLMILKHTVKTRLFCHFLCSNLLKCFLLVFLFIDVEINVLHDRQHLLRCKKLNKSLWNLIFMFYTFIKQINNHLMLLFKLNVLEKDFKRVFLHYLFSCQLKFLSLFCKENWRLGSIENMTKRVINMLKHQLCLCFSCNLTFIVKTILIRPWLINLSSWNQSDW